VFEKRVFTGQGRLSLGHQWRNPCWIIGVYPPGDPDKRFQRFSAPYFPDFDYWVPCHPTEDNTANTRIFQRPGVLMGISGI
jgi:hypothetical protein